MTYGVAISLAGGLVFASDSRTHTGPDQVNTFGKMHVMLDTPERFFVLLSAGNLATSQAVRTWLFHDPESMDATFILGGRLAGRGTGIFVVHPQGDYLHASEQTPYLQIGELKYGKPILDWLIRPGLSLQDAGRVALLSMDATMHSNLTVGPPVELLLYDEKNPEASRHMVFEAEDPYLRALRHGWQAQLEAAVRALPSLPSRGRPPEVNPSG